MLSISGNDNLNNINENSAVLRAGLDLYKNNSTKNSKNEFVDETDISSLAMKLYERDKDISKFTKLALTEMTADENNAMMKDLFNIASQMREDELADSLLEDERFIQMMFE